MAKKLEKQMRNFGLIGKNISYSFSKEFFRKKFENENIKDAFYCNFDISSINELPGVFKKQDIYGLNVTIPYKEVVIPFLDKLDKTARKIGAVNTIRVMKSGKLKGYNTDYYGFKKSLKPLLKKHHKKALILGTGGASKAVAKALIDLGLEINFVSRSKSKNSYNYHQLNKEIITSHLLIINCTPLGTYPNVKEYPDIPYIFLTKEHILYDLIYNPSETKFLKFGKEKDCQTINGLKMLELQAEKSWRIWNK